MMKNLQVIVPLAGADGDRDAFGVPRPLIPVHGKPLVKYCTDLLGWPFQGGSLRSLVFALPREMDQAYGLGDELRDLYRECDPTVVLLGGTDDGAATTVLEVLSRLDGHVDPEEPLLIHLTEVAYRANLEYAMANLPPHWIGAIPAFPSRNPRFGYLQTAHDGRVTLTAEQQVISDLASAGSYFFRKTREFQEAARSAVAAEENVRGSYSICPLYNHLIRKGRPVIPIRVQYVADLGDAAEVKALAD